MRLRVEYIGAIAIFSLLLLSTVAWGTVRTTVQFSPEEVWTTNIPEAYDNMSAVYTKDINGDQKAEIMVEMENYTAHTYGIMILNGSNGEILKSTKFMDVGYSESGDTVGMDATLYGITILDTQGSVQEEHYFMVFANHSNNKHISIYSVEYPSLNNISYKGIDIPSSINYGGVDIPVTNYGWIFHVLQINGEPHILYFGYYIGSLYGHQVEELQIIMMNKSLAQVWDKTLISPMSSVYPFTVDVVSFNGWGFHHDHEDVLIVNLTASVGNTTLDAIDASDGSLLWSVQLEGLYTGSSPIEALSSSSAYQFDYDNDGATDIALPTITQNEEMRLYFVSSTGNIMGYYVANGYPYFAIFTNVLVSSNLHDLVKSVDVNGDNYGEVFFIDNATYLVCWDVKNNQTVWSVNVPSSDYAYLLFLSTNDVNGDGIWDIYLIGQEKNGDTAEIRAINSVDGSLIYSKSYTNIILPEPGTLGVKEITDINGDGFQDAVVIQGYYNDGYVYVNITAVSLQDGSEIWNTSVYSELNNNDYAHWSAQALLFGDIDGDGTNDVVVRLYYHNVSAGTYSTYLRALSGVDGSVMWNGKVENDVAPTDLFAFKGLTIISPWNEFDYNDDGVINEMLITTGYSVQIYALSQPIPEFSYLGILLLIPAVFFLIKRRR